LKLAEGREENEETEEKEKTDENDDYNVAKQLVNSSYLQIIKIVFEQLNKYTNLYTMIKNTYGSYGTWVSHYCFNGNRKKKPFSKRNFKMRRKKQLNLFHSVKFLKPSSLNMKEGMRNNRLEQWKKNKSQKV
jgi:hypothetical protein